MHAFKVARTWLAGPCLIVSTGLVGSASMAAPVVTQVSGTFDHMAAVTITGSGFGAKSTAAPVIWDDASGSDIRTKWDVTWPNTTPATDMAYRLPQRGIALPHNHISKYLAGAQTGAGGAAGGANVAVWKNRTIGSYPAYTYASWYQRADDNWVFSSDNNYKCFDFSQDWGGYNLPYNWYIEYNARPESRTNVPGWHIIDDAIGLAAQSLDGPTSSWWFSAAVNPMSGIWSKVELEIKYTNQADGYIKLWENGVQKINYIGHTDRYSGNRRTEAIGGYAASRGSNNWRYFADIYLDYTPARVVLADNTTLSKATIIEPQIPTTWGSSAIQVSVNLGKFVKGQTAYLFVVDPLGVPSSSGFAVVIGGSSVQPRAPSDVVVE